MTQGNTFERRENCDHPGDRREVVPGNSVRTEPQIVCRKCGCFWVCTAIGRTQDVQG